MDAVLRISMVLVLCLSALGSKVKLPPDMSQAIFCESCSAVMQEIGKLLTKKSSDPRELQVVEAMEDICQAKYFSKYHYSPPTTIKACKFLIEKYEEELEQLLTKQSADYEKEVCYELTKACEGVDRSKKEKEEMDVRFNDQKQEVKKEKSTPQKDDDGIQRMNIDINDPGAAKRLADQIKMQVAQQQAMGGGSDDEDDEDDEDEDEEEDEDEDNSSKTKKKTEL